MSGAARHRHGRRTGAEPNRGGVNRTTSIDAAAVGISLALIDVNIWGACLVIGAVTTIVATGGVMLGKHIGAYLGRYAGILGGFVLVAIGGSILFQHLSA